MISLLDLNEKTATVVRKVLAEKRTRRSKRVKLGSPSPVIINPALNKTTNDDYYHDLRKSIKEAQSLWRLLELE